MVTTQPEYYLTSTVHTTSSPKGKYLSTKSAVTKSMSTHVIAEMVFLTFGKNVSDREFELVTY